MKKTTILYDSQIFDMQKYGGISRYFANLISPINLSPDFNAKLPLLYSSNYYVNKFPQLLGKFVGAKLLKGNKKRTHWNLKYSKYYIENKNFDIFHPTYYNPYFIDSLKKPMAITVHDMIHENHPDLFEDAPEIRAQKKIVMEAADLIIAISAYTKEQILHYYPSFESKIKVIYHGVPGRSIQPATIPLPKNYLLYVGDRTTGYKNFTPLVQAIAPLISRDMLLICAGGGAFNNEEINLFQDYGIIEHTLQLNASDAILKQLYQEAFIFVYPSIEEGFGFPILEAFKNGCPVACSSTSCFPEVGGTAVSYFDPSDTNSMRNVIAALVADEVLRIKRIKEGHEQQKLFTFDRCLNQTLESYRSLLV